MHIPTCSMVPDNEADDEDACAGCMNRPATVVIRRMCPQSTVCLFRARDLFL
jgi:hypothetical protein